MKHWDIYLGFGGAIVTFVADHFNMAVAGATGLVTLAFALIRLRREWRHRND